MDEYLIITEVRERPRVAIGAVYPMAWIGGLPEPTKVGQSGRSNQPVLDKWLADRGAAPAQTPSGSG